MFPKKRFSEGRACHEEIFARILIDKNIASIVKLNDETANSPNDEVNGQGTPDFHYPSHIGFFPSAAGSGAHFSCA